MGSATLYPAIADCRIHGFGVRSERLWDYPPFRKHGHLCQHPHCLYLRLSAVHVGRCKGCQQEHRTHVGLFANGHVAPMDARRTDGHSDTEVLLARHQQCVRISHACRLLRRTRDGSGAWLCLQDLSLRRYAHARHDGSHGGNYRLCDYRSAHRQARHEERAYLFPQRLQPVARRISFGTAAGRETHFYG